MEVKNSAVFNYGLSESEFISGGDHQRGCSTLVGLQ